MPENEVPFWGRNTCFLLQKHEEETRKKCGWNFILSCGEPTNDTLDLFSVLSLTCYMLRNMYLLKLYIQFTVLEVLGCHKSACRFQMKWKILFFESNVYLQCQQLTNLSNLHVTRKEAVIIRFVKTALWFLPITRCL